ncbi:hypothetical protein ACVBEF_12115 [Glaciimonas sp. GG7]
MPLRSIACVLSTTLLMSGCCATSAASIAQPEIPITPLTLANTTQIKTLARRVTVILDSGFSIMLMDGSHWRYIGTVPEGKVYKPKNGTLETNDKNPREFFIVTSEKKLIGFYLPSQHRYKPLEQSLYLTFND